MHNGHAYAVTLGFNPATGEVREIFTQGKVGSDMDAIITDISIILSILLQHGVDPSSFVGSMGKLGLGGEPASVIGRLVGLLVR